MTGPIEEKQWALFILVVSWMGYPLNLYFVIGVIWYILKKTTIFV